MWLKKRLLIWGLTYPEFSKTYYETICTGALDAATGRLVRVYPITLRHLSEPFGRFDWIEAEVERSEDADFRPESYRIKQDTVHIGEKVGTDKHGWAERRRLFLKDGNVFDSVEALRAAEAKDHTSLGIVRPKAVKRFYARTRTHDERAEWDTKRETALAQKDLFVDADAKRNELEFPPVEYRAEFTCSDPACVNGHDMSILDWGLYVLHRKQEREKGLDAAKAAVIAQLQHLMDRTRADPYLFLGNTKAHCENFMIVGLFHPPIIRQPDLFG